MLTVKTVLKPSSIHGLGVFADEPIKKGQIIWEAEYLLDLILSEKELERLPAAARDYIKCYGNTSKQHKGMIVVDFGNGRYMNHSDTPNTDFKTETGIAIRDIAVGEEITCDYSEYEDDTMGLHTFFKQGFA